MRGRADASSRFVFSSLVRKRWLSCGNECSSVVRECSTRACNLNLLLFTEQRTQCAFPGRRGKVCGGDNALVTLFLLRSPHISVQRWQTGRVLPDLRGKMIQEREGVILSAHARIARLIT